MITVLVQTAREQTIQKGLPSVDKRSDAPLTCTEGNSRCGMTHCFTFAIAAQEEQTSLSKWHGAPISRGGRPATTTLT